MRALVSTGPPAPLSTTRLAPQGAQYEEDQEQEREEGAAAPHHAARVRRRRAGGRCGGGRARDSARAESEQQAEHRVHRLRRPGQRQPQRAHHRAGTRRQLVRRQWPQRRRRASRARIRTRTSSSSATSTRVALDAASQRYPKAKTFNDLRRVFDNPNDFDAVVVSTAEHTHVFATYLALTHGKHVYCEKPLAYNIWEARLIRETAAKYPKLSTQMGNQGHASVARADDQGDPR